ncbi:MAG: ROK family transcriptional regulator [Propionibacteriaceae bacterium]|nr:ROK family transcriptional regulator [Propionibacteriaceae bacterium]
MLAMGPTRTMRARSLILDAIREHVLTSRSELIDLTDLTGATVSTNVRALMDEGFVDEVGTAASTGGKPRRMLQLVRNARYAVGVHLDHSITRLVLANLAGDVVATITDEGMESGDVDSLLERIGAHVDALIASTGVARSRVLGVGVCRPGPMSSSSDQILLPAHLEQWAHVPVAEVLERATGLPVLIDNDAAACALCEYWINPKGCQGLATLYMGSGLGGAAIIDGIPYRGVSGNSIEVGHICVDLEGPRCWCGNVGCIGEMAGPLAVVRRAHALGLLDAGDDASTLDQYRHLADLAHAGQAQALGLFADSARYIGVAAHVLATILDPDHIALTGPGFAAAGDLYVPAITEILQTRYVARDSHTIDVWVSQHADDAAATGAAILIFQSGLLFEQLLGAGRG